MGRMSLNVLVLSCSLNPASRSSKLADRAAERLKDDGAAVTLLDLRSEDVPLCDGFNAAHIDDAIRKSIEQADAILLAYDANAAAKALIELTGRAWTGKLVGFLCAAGGHGSYMSIMSLANSLMLDFRCLIIPRFVYASKSAFDGDRIVDEKVIERIDELCDETMRIGMAVKA